jgi:hypothetical protein
MKCLQCAFMCSRHRTKKSEEVGDGVAEDEEVRIMSSRFHLPTTLISEFSVRPRSLRQPTLRIPGMRRYAG